MERSVSCKQLHSGAFYATVKLPGKVKVTARGNSVGNAYIALKIVAVLYRK